MAKIKILSDLEVTKIMENNWLRGLDVIEDSFVKRSNNRVILPEKASQVFDSETQNRINCMPSTLLDDNICGMKWVSVFPTNKSKGIDNVHGVTLISEIVTGQPLVALGSTWLTKYRTAGVAAVAARYLANKNNESMGFIGAGQEARMHFELFKLLFPGIKECRISSRTHETCKAFYNEMVDKYRDVNFIICDNNYEKAIRGSDIVVTAISGQEAVLKADWLDKASFYVHVGGFEDEFAVAHKADKIVCDEWNAVKHRGSQTISKMYVSGILRDSDIYAELADVITKKKPGREAGDRLIYFNSVGMSYADVLLGKFVYDNSGDAGTVVEI